MANLKIETMPIGDLTPYHRNPRRGNMAAIAESLKARGQYKPIVVNKGTKTGIANEILAGNHTWQAAKSLGWTTIEAVIVDLDADQAAQIVLADNRIADLGGYDTDALAELLESIEQPTVGTGYSADDIAEIIAAAKPAPSELKDPDDVPPVPKKPYTKPGQIWKLGDSLLVVGSSTDDQLVTKAAGMIGQPSCIWTDPPYGVAYQGGTKDRLTIENDNDPNKAVEITKQAMQVAARICKPGCPFYMAHSDSLRGLGEVHAFLVQQAHVLGASRLAHQLPRRIFDAVERPTVFPATVFVSVASGHLTLLAVGQVLQRSLEPALRIHAGGGLGASAEEARTGAATTNNRPSCNSPSPKPTGSIRR